jgi:hypothetical protein
MYVSNQSELDAELLAFPWHDSFVREAHVLCPSYTVPGRRSVVAPDSKWLLRLVICSQDEQFPGIEFIFEGVDGLSLESRVDLCPRGTIASDGVVMFMTAIDVTPIQAERLRIQRLSVETWGPSTRYCEVNQFDDQGYPIE